MQPLLQVHHLRKIYGQKSATCTALERIDFTMNRGEYVSIMGPSGSGKTTSAQHGRHHRQSHLWLYSLRRCGHYPNEDQSFS